MTRILTSTAISALLMAAPVAAQDSGGSSSGSGGSGIFGQVPNDPQLQLGTDLIGSTVYSTETMSGGEGGGGDQPQSIGEINDIVVTQDGQVEFVIVGVGGFLGIGERRVAVTTDAIEYVQDPQNQGQQMLTIPASQQEIENAPEFDPAALQQGGAGGEAEQAADSAGNAAEDAGQSAENAADSAGNAASDAANSATDAAEDAANSAGNAAQDATNAAQDAASSAGQAAQDAASSAGQAVQDAADSATNAAEDAADSAGNAAEQAGDAADNATSGN